MKKLLILLMALSVSFSVFSQENRVGFEEAQKLAKEQHKRIMILFQGSDWCAPCIKWERSVWSSEEFNAFAEEELIVVKADFPRRKSNQLSSVIQEENKELAERYNTNGYFPFVVLLSPELKILKSFSYIDYTPKQMIDYFNE